jgi:hypothetical protein
MGASPAASMRLKRKCYGSTSKPSCERRPFRSRLHGGAKRDVRVRITDPQAMGIAAAATATVAIAVSMAVYATKGDLKELKGELFTVLNEFKVGRDPGVREGRGGICQHSAPACTAESTWSLLQPGASITAKGDIGERERVARPKTSHLCFLFPI